jgi:hypothetical protein
MDFLNHEYKILQVDPKTAKRNLITQPKLQNITS